jgi:hypothetical protein
MCPHGFFGGKLECSHCLIFQPAREEINRLFRIDYSGLNQLESTGTNNISVQYSFGFNVFSTRHAEMMYLLSFFTARSDGFAEVRQ